MLYFIQNPLCNHSTWRTLLASTFRQPTTTSNLCVLASRTSSTMSPSASSPPCAESNSSSITRIPAPQSEAAWAEWRRIGSPKYVVAPMVDGSELAFRDICRRYDAEIAYTPMLHSRSFSRDVKYRREHFTTHAQDRPLVAQFCANDPQLFVQAAKHVQDHVDAVDLNLGCPQGIAKKGHYGSFLQDEWTLLHDILSTGVKELNVPVWCKIRVFEDTNKTLEYVKMLQSTGIYAIAVHGRTREQKGKNAPLANWDIIKIIKQSLSIPVIVNGNVRDLNDANEALRFTGADAVMSAWALLDNPSTFKHGLQSNRMRLAKEYLQLAEKHNTPLRMVRLHLFKLFRSRLDVNMDLNEAVARCRSFDDFHTVVGVLENRCDFDGISFEQRVESGNVPENVVCEKKLERMKRDEMAKEKERLKAEDMAMKMKRDECAGRSETDRSDQIQSL